MKKIILPFLVLISLFAHSQSNTQIEIDTLEVNFDIKNIVEVNSLVPQIKGGINSVAQKKINDDIKKHFEYTPFNDSTYVNKLHNYYEIDSIQLNYGSNEEYRDGITENFTVEYASNNILNISIFSQIYPYLGRPQFFFKSLIYNLNTGDKLIFDDFFSIPTDTLKNTLNSEGYYIFWDNDAQKLKKEKLKELVWVDNICPEFYFNYIEDELYLMIRPTCLGPALIDYGIPLKTLKQFVEHFEFKNKLQLWGTDINSLIGQDRVQFGKKIVFEDYPIQYIGGYLLPIDNFNNSFGIQEYSSSDKRILLFFKSIDTHQEIIIDILEIDNSELENRILTEYCITKNGLETEIIALVNPTETEFHTKIIKAWRANRKTGKFEYVNERKIEKCPNHSYGL
ncbi:hypothetical protein ACFSQ0_07990 [Mesonia sediminis]|uniref:DUF3298 domain-containing protein n=1 Tax=Mesonia sediminis TaxID=1703946 RepID=A0ABW5SEH7_9FLAO